MTCQQDTTLGNYKFRKGDEFVIEMQGLQHNPKYWIRPEEFLPERFDPESPLFLDP